MSGSDDEQDVSSMIQANPQQIPNVASSSSPTYGPHHKLSRGEEINKFQHEFEMVKERKFVCSLSLLLQIFEARCQTPGCVHVANSQLPFYLWNLNHRLLMLI